MSKTRLMELMHQVLKKEAILKDHKDEQLIKSVEELYQDDLRTIKSVLKDADSKSLNEPDENGFTLLHHAVTSQKASEIIPLLIQKGANPDVVSKTKPPFNLVEYAARFGTPQMLQYCITHFPLQCVPDSKSGQSALMTLILENSKNFPETIRDKFALEMIPDIQSLLKNPQAIYQRNPALIFQLIDSPMRLGINRDRLIRLLEQAISPSESKSQRYTEALNWTLAGGYAPEITQYLLDRGANPDGILEKAAKGSNHETLRFLIDIYPGQCTLQFVTQLEGWLKANKNAGTNPELQAYALRVANMNLNPVSTLQSASTDKEKDQLRMLRGKMLYHKSYPRVGPREYAAAALAWSGITNPRHLTSEDNLLMGQVMCHVRTQPIPYCYMDYPQFIEQTKVHLELAQNHPDLKEINPATAKTAAVLLEGIVGGDKKLEAKSTIQTFEILDWQSFNDIMGNLLNLVVERDLYATDHLLFKLLEKIALLKTKAEQTENPEGVFGFIKTMQNEIEASKSSGSESLVEELSQLLNEYNARLITEIIPKFKKFGKLQSSDSGEQKLFAVSAVVKINWSSLEAALNKYNEFIKTAGIAAKYAELSDVIQTFIESSKTQYTQADIHKYSKTVLTEIEKTSAEIFNKLKTDPKFMPSDKELQILNHMRSLKRKVMEIQESLKASKDKEYKRVSRNI